MIRQYARGLFGAVGMGLVNGVDVAVGANLRRVRRLSGLKLRALSDRAAVGEFRLAQIEAGRARASPIELIAMAEALDVRIAELYRNAT